MSYDYSAHLHFTFLSASLNASSGDDVIQVDTLTAEFAGDVRSGGRYPLRIGRGTDQEQVVVTGVNDEANNKLDVERNAGPYGLKSHPVKARVAHPLPARAAQETVAAPLDSSALHAAIQVLRRAIDKLDTREQAKEVTKSGGGGKVFTFTHDLGAVPAVAQVLPETSDAKGTFWVTSKSATDVRIQYKNAPASGTDNLTWNLYLHL